jgi:tetratricopeptide (TPR) repeat protein
MQAQLQVAYSEFSHLYLIGDTMKFYRGQRIGSLITVNSYLSASITRNIAMTYIHGSPSGELIPVIFEISAEFKDPNVPRRKPFAYIGHLSHYHAAELEVLFSIGSFFRVEEITLDEEKNINIIKLTFIYDEDHHTITDDYGTLRACSLEEKLIKTGDLLSNHVKYGASEADTFYQRFLEGDYSPLIKAACHVGLGWLAFKLTKFDLAITCQEKALQMYKTLNDEHCSNYLYVISYNCIGAVYKQQKEYSKALSYYLKAYKIDSTVISIDKYAFYNSFNNIAAVNIAYIYKIQGYIEQAWSTYKDMLASAMNKSTLFHGATYLKIAEADFSEGTQCKNNNEQMEYIDNWKRFLDLSLTDMSSSYRRSIVSGALSIGLRFAHNEQTWNQAIDYYKKIIQVSSKFVNVSSDDYHIVIRCYQQIAELYRKKHSFAISISYAADGLNKLCKVSDLESITSFYESMIKTYEHKLQQMNSNSSPDDIDSKISLDRTKFATIVLNFERNEFSFGQYAKKLNGNLLKEPNLKRCLAYCRLKTAALKHDQGKTKGIRELLYETSTLLPDDEQIQLICNNNLAYLDNKFYQIIDNYKKSLEKRLNENQTSCIGEDAFCYIAHLYGQMDDINAAQQWYIKAITYFMDHKFVCEHTQSCFVKMASFYQTKNDLPSCVSTYLQLVHHLLNYRDGTFQLQREIVVIVEYLLKQLDTDNKEQICILERLKQLVLRQFKDIDFLDADFQWIIDRYTKNKKHSWIAAHAYESYLDHIFQYINRPLTPYVQMITPNFRRAITFYKLSDDPAGAFDVYQRLVDIVLKHPEDRNHIISTFKRIGLDLEEKRQTKAVLDIYEALRQFIFEHPAQIVFQDNDLIIYILVRHQMLIERDKEPAAPIYRKMIHILRSHKEQFNPDFKLQLYLELLEKYYMGLGLVEPLSALDSYYNLLDIFLNLRSENFDNLLTKIVNAMKDRPVELLELLTKYQFNYIQLIRQVYRRLSHPNDRSIMCILMI